MRVKWVDIYGALVALLGLIVAAIVKWDIRAFAALLLLQVTISAYLVFRRTVRYRKSRKNEED